MKKNRILFTIAGLMMAVMAVAVEKQTAPKNIGLTKRQPDFFGLYQISARSDGGRKRLPDVMS